MSKQPRGELALRMGGFDYSPLDRAVAEHARTAAVRIRERVKKTIEDIIEVGNDLRAVKEALPHGAFGPWLKAEFGWGERMAQNFMRVAEQFGPKSEIIADLTIQPTAAYLLAAPSVPDEAREKAIERAEAGEQITAAVAQEIVAKARKKGRKKARVLPSEKLLPRLTRTLERYRERWSGKELPDLARCLREYAEELEKRQEGEGF